jgi:hypothetical protein
MKNLLAHNSPAAHPPEHFSSASVIRGKKFQRVEKMQHRENETFFCCVDGLEQGKFINDSGIYELSFQPAEKNKMFYSIFFLSYTESITLSA